MIGGGIFSLPQLEVHRALISFLQAVIKRFVYLKHAAVVDVMGEFMDDDGFGRVGITLQPKDVFFCMNKQDRLILRGLAREHPKTFWDSNGYVQEYRW